MQSYSLRELKSTGHKLLDEYIELNLYFGARSERKKAYLTLAERIKCEEIKAHFGHMATEAEVNRAIEELHGMIRRRKKKIEQQGWNKREFAPNLQELQKQANDLNQHLHE